ncbi:hypothetical protein [Arcticibacterium luteifluviistationis]|uniref:Outer membrane protein beta-barrel domain-containing protein n=1 Tax=Arcticibacterium luteifluviistationis TaxID=1784714 RepID=A0A2Z4G6U5_9BACT|nr:hypothetical protein [Arcticibacterium luteifluviistationis]AWV96877.1 hypothetical protein DJ013_01230 [Arcticibacterium luteifluviistationis]
MKSLLIVLLGILSASSLYAQEEITKEKPVQILSLQPIVIGAYSESSVMGIGVSYEREISNKMAWQLPVQYYFKGNGYEGFGISPTLKLYPFGLDRTVTWSVGPGLRYSLVKDDYYYYSHDSYYNSSRYENAEFESVFGFEVQNGLGINIDRFNFGINSSLGLNYTQGITGTFINTMTIGIRL